MGKVPVWLGRELTEHYTAVQWIGTYIEYKLYSFEAALFLRFSIFGTTRTDYRAWAASQPSADQSSRNTFASLARICSENSVCNELDSNMISPKEKKNGRGEHRVEIIQISQPNLINIVIYQRSDNTLEGTVIYVGFLIGAHLGWIKYADFIFPWENNCRDSFAWIIISSHSEIEFRSRTDVLKN